ncbi:MAG: glycosyltransferase, partial [Spirochaetaceae bacterium]|nr:glycosyltransferase [Spirochaetaceae bacterium]
MKLLIAVPTYNEAENIRPFIDAVFRYITLHTTTTTTTPGFIADNDTHGAGAFSADILVIDDNSPDGTADIVEKLIYSYPERLHLLKRPGKQGLGTAYLAAFEWGLSREYDVFL